MLDVCNILQRSHPSVSKNTVQEEQSRLHDPVGQLLISEETLDAIFSSVFQSDGQYLTHCKGQGCTVNKYIKLYKVLSIT